MALTFLHRFEQQNLDATHDFSAGDTTGTHNNSPTYDPVAAKVGTNGLLIDGASERTAFDSASIATPSVGSIAVWVQFPTAIPTTDGAQFFMIRGTNSNDYVRLATHSGSGASNRNFRFGIRNNAGAAINLDADDNESAPGNWYFLVATWDTTVPSMTLDVYDTSGTLLDSVSSGTAITAPADFTSIRFGDSTGTTGTVYLKNAFIGDAVSDAADFVTNRDTTSYTAYGGGALPPSITDVDEDNTVTLEQANVEIDGTDFDDDVVEIRQGGFTYTPSVDSNSGTAIVFDMAAIGTTGPVTAPHAGSATVAVINVDLQEDTQAITISNRSGSNTLLIGTPNADPDLRLTSTADAVAGDYVMWFNVQGGVIGDVTVNDDLTFDVASGVTAFDFQIWDAGDGTWGDANTQTIAANVQPAFIGPNINDFELLVDEAMAPRDYSTRFSDTDPLTFTVVGVLPTGLSLSAEGVLSGTPTVIETASSLEIRADDGSLTRDSNSFAIDIVAELSPTSSGGPTWRRRGRR